MKLLQIIFCVLCGALAATAQQAQTVDGLPSHKPVALSISAKPTDRPVRNVIFMIGDGMGAEHVWAAWLCNRGALNITQLPYTALSCTVAANRTVTDSAAGGTALACGGKTNNGMLGQRPNGEPMESLAEICRRRGMATGLVVTKAITDATPAAFYAHTASRKNTAAIAQALADAHFDVVLGGGAAAFTPDQLAQMRARGADVELFAPGDCPPASKRGNLLCKNVQRALGRLQSAPGGFFLMIEGSSIDMAAHGGNLRETVLEVLDFDSAVGVVLRWMANNPDTLLVVTADHQTGGLSILDGNAQKGRVTGVFTTDGHSGLVVPVYAAGAGAARFHGVLQNTQVAHIIKESVLFQPAVNPAN
ncbi:MAG: alkaline phosphatase [Akkermansia sp.]|nr:alkaline phosphatase [Akkermansia sp.]